MITITINDLESFIHQLHTTPFEHAPTLYMTNGFKKYDENFRTSTNVHMTLLYKPEQGVQAVYTSPVLYTSLNTDDLKIVDSIVFLVYEEGGELVSKRNPFPTSSSSLETQLLEAVGIMEDRQAIVKKCIELEKTYERVIICDRLSLGS